MLGTGGIDTGPSSTSTSMSVSATQMITNAPAPPATTGSTECRNSGEDEMLYEEAISPQCRTCLSSGMIRQVSQGLTVQQPAPTTLVAPSACLFRTLNLISDAPRSTTKTQLIQLVYGQRLDP